MLGLFSNSNILFFFGTLLPCVYGRPNGAPEDACFYMTPRHLHPHTSRKVFPQSGDGFYNITVSSNTFRPDRPIKVYIIQQHFMLSFKHKFGYCFYPIRRYVRQLQDGYELAVMWGRYKHNLFEVRSWKGWRGGGGGDVLIKVIVFSRRQSFPETRVSPVK
ncbi:hypothetical protein ACJMK2_007770 [Sinanodonta woodiana]|uniref:Uncharacterized protein n=1 Tax=Sinanodonta woodiana TaxID=1069815 RepID=A0ABD3VJR0_SINWO